MKKSVQCLLAVVTVLACCGSASADQVGVFGDRYDLNVINSFYNSLPGHSSAILGNLDNLSGIGLLWAVQPADSYSATELSQMSDFIADGGRIAFMGEHGLYAPDENNRIGQALAYFGSGISIINNWPDGGYHDATRNNGQIFDHSLTAGVDTYNYACFAELNLTGNAQALMVGTDHSQVMMGYENIGAGSIFLITDQNVWDNVYSASYDNAQMFENLLTAATTPVPLPAGVLLGLLGLATARWKLRKH